MSAPFQPGDVVEAVGVRQGAVYDAERFYPRPDGLRRYSTVATVERQPHWDMVGITLVGVPGVWGEICFRKIEAPRTEIATLIRACRPAKVRA